MSKPDLHPWLDSPEAVAAARRSLSIPRTHMYGAFIAVGEAELFSEALAILTECALPPRDRPTVCVECGSSLDGVRNGAKFCSPRCRKRQAARVHRGKATVVPDVPKSHIGSMWSWPEDKTVAYATREIGFRLCNYLQSRKQRFDIPSSPYLENTDIEVIEERDVRDVLEDYLTEVGIGFDGTETLDELAEAVTYHRLSR